MKLSVRDSNNYGSASNQLNEMYTQLFASTGLSVFCYARFYKNRQFCMVSSNNLFQQTYLEHEFYNKIYQHYEFDTLNRGKFFCDDIAEHESQQEALDITKASGISNVMVINEVQEDYTEIFNLGSPATVNGINSVYLNYHDFIDDYLTITKTEINKLIKRFSIPTIYIPPSANLQKEFPNRREFDAREIIAQKSQLHDNHIALSKRESSCLALLMHGLSSEEIGNKLYISKRTVENNINRVLDKLNVSSRIKLLSTLHQNYRFYPSHQIVVPCV